MAYTLLNPKQSLSVQKVTKSETYTCPANSGTSVSFQLTPPSGGGWVLVSFAISLLGMGQEGYVRSFSIDPINNVVIVYLHNTSSSAATDKTLTIHGNYVKVS